MYDQTEATARMTVLPWIEMQRKKGSVGRVLFNGRLWLSEMKKGVNYEKGFLFAYYVYFFY